MVIKSIDIRNFGNIENFKCEFNKKIAVFVERDYDSLAAALGLASLNGIFYGMCAGNIKYGEDTHISATFDFAGAEWRTEYFYSNAFDGKGFYVDENLHGKLYKNDEEVSLEEYQDVLLASFDDNEAFWFNNDKKIMGDISNRLNWARSYEDIGFFAKASKAEAPYNTHYLQKMREFVQSFQPVLIKDRVDFKTYLQFNDSLVFECVRVYDDGRKETEKNPSAEDITMFNFSCFSTVACFMQGLNSGFSYAKKPVFIFNLLGQIDLATDASTFLNQVSETGCNVFVFEPNGVQEGQNDANSFQII